jgi:hypothetical protein
MHPIQLECDVSAAALYQLYCRWFLHNGQYKYKPTASGVAYSQWSCLQPVELPTASGVAYSQWSCLQPVELSTASGVAYSQWSCLQPVELPTASGVAYSQWVVYSLWSCLQPVELPTASRADKRTKRDGDWADVRHPAARRWRRRHVGLGNGVAAGYASACNATSAYNAASTQRSSHCQKPVWFLYSLSCLQLWAQNMQSMFGKVSLYKMLYQFVRV